LKSLKEEVVAKTAVVLISDGCNSNILVNAWEKSKSRQLVRKITDRKIEGRIVNFKRGYVRDKDKSGGIRIIDFFCVESARLSSFPSAFIGIYEDLKEEPPTICMVVARVFVANALRKHNWIDCDDRNIRQGKFLKLGAECRANTAFFFSKDNSYLDVYVSKILQALERQAS